MAVKVLVCLNKGCYSDWEWVCSVVASLSGCWFATMQYRQVAIHRGLLSLSLQMPLCRFKYVTTLVSLCN